MLSRLIERIYIRTLKSRELHSLALRHHFKKKYDISVGLYSYGCFDSTRIRRGTKIGRYCSFASTATVFTRNHPIQYLTTHPLLYESCLGLDIARNLPFGTCEFEDDIWVGHNSVVLPAAKHIGRGSIIGAGAVVTKNVPRYSVVAGSPATVIRYRFSPEMISWIEATRWWEKSIEELTELLHTQPDLAFDPTRAFEIAKGSI